MRFILSTILFTAIIIGISSCSSGLFRGKPPVTLDKAWTSDNTLRTPESVLLDPQRGMLYVSNINKNTGSKKDGDGFISKLDTDGDIEELYWVSGLNDPHGLALFNNVLYVADIDEIVAISTQTGSILGKYKADKAEMLNDVAVDASGNVYVTDTERKRVYVLRNGRVSTWLQKTKDSRPNGLYVEGDRMVIAFSGSGKAKLVDLDSKDMTNWTDKIPSADGIAQIGNGSYFISNWNGEVYYVNEEGKNWRVLNTKSKNVNSADISYSEQNNMLYVPTFNDNRVVAYSVAY